jgi:hypothetical protein
LGSLPRPLQLDSVLAVDLVRMEGGNIQAIYSKPNGSAYERRAVGTIERAKPRRHFAGGGISTTQSSF